MAFSQISRVLVQHVRHAGSHQCLSISLQNLQRQIRLKEIAWHQVRCCSNSKTEIFENKAEDAAPACLSTQRESVETNGHLGNGQPLRKTLHTQDGDLIRAVGGIQNELRINEDYEDESDSELLHLDSDIEKLPKKVFEPEFHLGAYVNESETLRQLIKLGVDLSEIQKIDGMADYMIKLDFETQVKPYIMFLHDVGVQDGSIGDYLSKNPLILKEDLNDLQSRVQYMKSKKFSTDSISRIVSRAYVFLLLSVKQVDGKLGYLQKEYKLTGNEVRYVVTKQPKLITWNTHKLKDNRFYMKEFLGFSEAELTQILLTCPKVLLTNKYAVGKKFDYLYNTMEIDHQTLTQWPNVFRCRLHILQQRHRFLLSVGCAQYNPTKPNFVSLQALVSGQDRDFCIDVAKASVAQYNIFLKTV